MAKGWPRRTALAQLGRGMRGHRQTQAVCSAHPNSHTQNLIKPQRKRGRKGARQDTDKQTNLPDQDIQNIQTWLQRHVGYPKWGPQMLLKEGIRENEGKSNLQRKAHGEKRFTDTRKRL